MDFEVFHFWNVKSPNISHKQAGRMLTNHDRLCVKIFMFNDNCFSFFVAFWQLSSNPYNSSTILIDCALNYKIWLYYELQDMIYKIVPGLQFCKPKQCIPILCCIFVILLQPTQFFCEPNIYISIHTIVCNPHNSTTILMDCTMICTIIPRLQNQTMHSNS